MSAEYREEYGEDLVKDWDNRLTFLSTVAETQPQAICSAFFNGFKNKLIYFQPFETSIAAVTRGHIRNDKDRVLISLPTRNGGLVIPVFHQTGN